MTGQVNVNVYFGTMYDWQNIPFHPYSIKTAATKTLKLQGYFVWQTTWLSFLRLNVDDYNDIVGAQWIEVVESDTSQYHGSHWYYVQDYVQVNNKLAQLTVRYDALMSLGVDNITGISGTCRRWTVQDDSNPFAYVVTSEPVDQADPFQYSYELISTLSASLDYWRFIGSPVDLEGQPEILNYTNPDGGEANIFYPEMKAINAPTKFSTAYPAALPYGDGLQYYFWDTSPEIPKNYSLAIGLGYNLVTNSFAIPKTSMVEFQTDGLKLKSITGTKVKRARDSMAGKGLTEGGYANAKTRAMGLFFTLYNSVSGSQITVKNYELSELGIDVWIDPSPNGRFYAKFSGYLSDSTGTSGAVPSLNWQDLTLSSSIGHGSLLASINNNYDIVAAKRERQEAGVANLESMLNGVVSGLANMGWGKSQGSEGLKLSGGFQIFSSVFFGAIHQVEIETRYKQERERLTVEGTISKNTPPSVVFGPIMGTNVDAYRFYVRAATLSVRDRNRLDRFFTAYGYNVDSLPLNDVSMLNARMRFTYIMADDVRVTAGADQTRVRDVQTMEQITQRFANGVRIWQVTPDYDWTVYNQPRGVN